MEANKQTFNAPEIKLHFLDYWRIIRIRKTVIIAVFLLVAITTTLVTFILPETYSSSVRIRVDKDVSDTGGFEAQRNYLPFDLIWVQTEFETIQSKSILYQVITNLNLSTRFAQKYKQTKDLPTDITYGILKRQTDVRQPRQTSLIEIRVFSENPSEAAEIANEIAKVYRLSRLNQRKEMSARGIQTLRDELQQQETKVKEQQQRVDTLKAKYQISDTEAMNLNYVSPNFIEQQTVANTERLRIESQKEYAKIYTTYAQLTNLTPTELRKALSTVSPDNRLQILLQQLSDAEQKLAQAGQVFGAEHPEVKSLQKVIDQIDTQVNACVDGIMNGLATKTAAQKAELDQLQKEVDVAKAKDIKVTLERREYMQARRDLEYLQDIRQKLWTRVRQEEVDAAIPKTGMVEIIDPAEAVLKAVRPNKPINIALGIIVGLAMGIGLAFFIEYLDTSVKTIDDVERALQAPVLGVIPQNVGSLLEEGPDSPHAEAYRVLRTNILFSQKDPKLNTITIVSGGAGEGKSTTTFNLATIFAQNGQRVLVVDSDLRRPSLHKFLKVTNSIGLTNYLLKQNTLEEVIQTSPLPTLDFMPSGKLPSSSMGVLSSQQMKDLIRELKRRYDFVFFDSPPIMGVSDASILASEVDMVMQVIQYRRYPQPMTIRAKQMIEKVGGNLVGIVLNNINMSSDENYYYYSGYYYDYYSKSEESKPEKPADTADKTPEANPDKVEIKSKY